MEDGQPAALDPVTVIRSRPYLLALVLAALLGIPISAVAYGFLALVDKIQEYLFTDLPQDLFTGGAPAWWPVPWLVLCGLLTGLTIKHLPGNGGHSPAFGFKAGGGVAPDRELPGIILAALTTLSLGAVLGPEAPLIAIGGGLAALTIHLLKKDAPPMAVTVMASAGSFAAISTLLGSPAARRLPDHGGRRHRRRDAEPGRPAGAARLRRRRPGLHRPGQLDRPRHLLARAHLRAPSRGPDGGHDGLGGGDGRWAAPCWGG